MLGGGYVGDWLVPGEFCSVRAGVDGWPWPCTRGLLGLQANAARFSLTPLDYSVVVL